MPLDLSAKQWPINPWENPEMNPNARAFQNLEKYHHRGFITEGTMVAIPLGFSGITTNIPADESAITALTIDSDRRIYGGTSGQKVHIFCAFTRGVTGMVHDLGVVPGATYCQAVMVGADEQVYACVSNHEQGWIVVHPPENIPYDCLQEWGFTRTPFRTVVEPSGQRSTLNEPLAHAVIDPSKQNIYGVTAKTGHLFCFNINDQTVEIYGKIDEVHRFGTSLVFYNQQIIGTNSDGAIWHFDLLSKKLIQTDCLIPCTAGREFNNQVQAWAIDQRNQIIYGAGSSDGFLFAYHPEKNKLISLGKPAVSRTITALAVTNDSRLFGMSGDENEISHLFVYQPTSGEIKDLGIPVSVLNERTYGYFFKSAVVGKDGEIFFGQAERISHLWCYFPAILTNDTYLTNSEN